MPSRSLQPKDHLNVLKNSLAFSQFLKNYKHYKKTKNRKDLLLYLKLLKTKAPKIKILKMQFNFDAF